MKRKTAKRGTYIGSKREYVFKLENPEIDVVLLQENNVDRLARKWKEIKLLMDILRVGD